MQQIATTRVELTSQTGIHVLVGDSYTDPVHRSSTQYTVHSTQYTDPVHKSRPPFSMLGTDSRGSSLGYCKKVIVRESVKGLTIEFRRGGVD
eukprot:SAG25_NODE_63_length_17756_cov_10.156765_4_plen_92_part_00